MKAEFGMSQWCLWAVLLLVQNASFTLVSRARNSRSVLYHSVAAVFSNGVWFGSMFITVDVLNLIRKTQSFPFLVGAGAFYILMTVTGSVASHYLLMRFVETKIQ